MILRFEFIAKFNSVSRGIILPLVFATITTTTTCRYYLTYVNNSFVCTEMKGVLLVDFVYLMHFQLKYVKT